MALSRRSLFVTLAIAAAAISVLLKFLPLSTRLSATTESPRLYTAYELSIHNGTDPSLPILLGILGSVYDVTRGRSHYGQGGAYHYFAGRDASASFVTGDSSFLTDSVANLSTADAKSIFDWRSFYDRSYTFSGYLIGRYYDAKGSPTKHLRAAEAKAARGRQLEEKRKKEDEKVKVCNSRWSQDEGGEVWCEDDDDEGGARFPRLALASAAEIALTGKVSKRCICVEKERLGEAGLELYDGCDFHATRCRV